jgi:hypothetical protein
MNKIMKLFICFFIVFNVIKLYGENVNIIMKDGKVIQAELLGKTEDKILIKDTEGKAKEIMLKKIKHIFNAKTGEKIEFELKEKIIAPVKEIKSLTEVESSKALYKIPEQEKYIVLDKGIIKPKIRTGKLIFFDLDLIYLDCFPNLYDSISHFLIPKDSIIEAALGSEISFFIRPLDFIAFGIYYRFNWWGPEVETKDGYEINLPQQAFGLNTKIIYYSVMTKGYEDDFYLMIQTGIRNLNTPFNHAQIINPDKTSIDINTDGTFDFGIFLGMVIDLFDVKIGYRYCKFTNLSIVDNGKLPSGSLPLELDLKGLTISIGGKLEI